MLKAIIFDFDGVICESVEAKTEAFRRLFADYPQHLERIIEYHMVNGGISRFEKFKTIYRDFLKKELSPEESKRLGEKFTEYSLDVVLKCPFVDGAYDFLQKYHKKVLLFVASGTPQEEIDCVVQGRGLEEFFTGVFGSPAKKHQILTNILREHSLKQEEAVFVGDSINDYDGAREVGVGFIGRLHDKYEDPFAGLAVKDTIKNLKDLEVLLKVKDLL